MKLKELKNEIIEYGREIDKKGLSPGMSGNISIKIEDKILITSSGSSNGDLGYDDLILIDFDSNIIEGYKKPSSEKLLHFEIYKKNPRINAILHVHPPFLSAFATARKSLDKPFMAENVYYFDKIPLAPYALPSSFELAQETAKFFDKYNAVLMSNHGFVIGDFDIKQAYLKLELAESYAQVVLNATILGGAVELTQEEVCAINNLKT